MSMIERFYGAKANGIPVKHAAFAVYAQEPRNGDFVLFALFSQAGNNGHNKGDFSAAEGIADGIQSLGNTFTIECADVRSASRFDDGEDTPIIAELFPVVLRYAQSRLAKLERT